MSVFGISRAQAGVIWGLLRERITDPHRGDERAWYSTLAAMSTALPWETLVTMQPLWLASSEPAIGERQLIRDFDRIYSVLKEHPLANSDIRYAHLLDELPNVTCIVDGTVIPVRQRNKEDVWDDALQRYKTVDRNYSGKHKEICLKVEFWVDLAGVPIFCRGAVPGSCHDARLFKEPPTGEKLLPHFINEYFLCDSGYEGCPHCITPYKKHPHEELTEEQKYFNDRLALVRSRVERFFSFLDVFRVFTYCEHDESWLTKAAYICLNIFYTLFASHPQYPLVRVQNPDPTTMFGATECWCSKGCAVPPDAKAQRIVIHQKCTNSTCLTNAKRNKLNLQVNPQLNLSYS